METVIEMPEQPKRERIILTVITRNDPGLPIYTHYAESSTPGSYDPGFQVKISPASQGVVLSPEELNRAVQGWISKAPIVDKAIGDEILRLQSSNANYKRQISALQSDLKTQVNEIAGLKDNNHILAGTNKVLKEPCEKKDNEIAELKAVNNQWADTHKRVVTAMDNEFKDRIKELEKPCNLCKEAMTPEIRKRVKFLEALSNQLENERDGSRRKVAELEEQIKRYNGCITAKCTISHNLRRNFGCVHIEGDIEGLKHRVRELEAYTDRLENQCCDLESKLAVVRQDRDNKAEECAALRKQIDDLKKFADVEMAKAIWSRFGFYPESQEPETDNFDDCQRQWAQVFRKVFESLGSSPCNTCKVKVAYHRAVRNGAITNSPCRNCPDNPFPEKDR